MELTTVTDTEAIFFDGSRRIVFDGLEPDAWVEVAGNDVRTLPRPGELLCRFATVNDVHFGETEAGKIDGSDVGPVCSVPQGGEPYPDFMNRGAIIEIAGIDPAVVVVKGDLTSNGTTAEYEMFRSAYEPAFGDRLVVVRGNHDSYHGESYADTSTQEVALTGVTLAVLDTSRLHQVNGSLSGDQLAWLDELATRIDGPVLVFGHHQIWNPDHDRRHDAFFGLRPADSEALFEVFRRRANLAGYFAGHTHRNHRQVIAMGGGAPFVEVACVKDYPGTWAEYRVHDHGILQIHHRISTPEALAWTEQTRHMYDGGYGWYAFGDIGDRCFAIDVDRR